MKNSIWVYLVPIMWGVSVYFGGVLAKKNGDIFDGHFWIALGMIFWGIVILFSTNFRTFAGWRWDWEGLTFGLTYALGGLTFVLAMASSGPIKTSALSALYPAITVLMVCLLQGQNLSIRQIIGVSLSVVVGWLMVPG